MTAAPPMTILERARREQHTQLELGLFAHLLERFPPFMRQDQVTAVTGWGRSTVYELCETPWFPGGPMMLEAHELPDRKRADKRITRRSVAVLLLRTATYPVDQFASLLALTLPTMTLPQLKQLHSATAAEIAKQTR